MTSPCTAIDTPSSVPTIDTHAHVFLRTLPLDSRRRYAPDYDASLEAYLAHLDDHGLSHGVLVQPSFLGNDNAFLVAGLNAFPSRLRGIAVVDVDVTREGLRALDAAGIVGARLNLVGEARPAFADEPWTSFLDAVRERSWQVEVQRSSNDVAVIARALVDRDVEVVIDHFALPSIGAGPGDRCYADVLALGASRRAWVKLSAPYRTGLDRGVLADRVYPALRTAFGLDRLMWGSDWPHTRFEHLQTYSSNREFFDALVPLPAERARILAAPRHLFRFG